MKNLVLICSDPIIQSKKPKEFQEGDRIFDGEEIRVLAEDFINVGKWVNQSDVRTVAVKVKEPESSEEKPKSVRYDVKTLKDAVWIPTIEQMIELIDLKLLKLLMELEAYIKTYPEYFDDDFLLNLLKYYLGTVHGIIYKKGRRLNTTNV